jgi:hypothetical protein
LGWFVCGVGGGSVGVGLFCGGRSGVVWMRCLKDEGYLTDFTMESDGPSTFDSRSGINALGIARWWKLNECWNRSGVAHLWGSEDDV